MVSDRRGADAAIELEADTLERWLRASGALPTGEVAAMRIDRAVETTVSRLMFLAATYSGDAPVDLPRHLIVKSLRTPSPPASALGERDFYRSVAPRLSSPPLVRCLAVVDDAAETIVLEDVSASHDHPAWPLPPSREQTEYALDALARIHAKW